MKTLVCVSLFLFAALAEEAREIGEKPIISKRNFIEESTDASGIEVTTVAHTTDGTSVDNTFVQNRNYWEHGDISHIYSNEGRTAIENEDYFVGQNNDGRAIAVPVPHPTPARVDLPLSVPVPVQQRYPVPVAKHVPVPVVKEVPYPVVKEVPYPVDKPVYYPVEKPVPYPVIKNVPYPVRIPVDRPYPVPVPRPYPVPVVQNVPYPVQKTVHYPVPIQVKFPVSQPVSVPFQKPYPVSVPHPVPVSYVRPYPVRIYRPYPVPYERKIPISQSGGLILRDGTNYLDASTQTAAVIHRGDGCSGLVEHTVIPEGSLISNIGPIVGPPSYSTNPKQALQASSSIRTEIDPVRHCVTCVDPSVAGSVHATAEEHSTILDVRKSIEIPFPLKFLRSTDPEYEYTSEHKAMNKAAKIDERSPRN